MPSNPKISKQIKRDAMGALVAPQKTEPMPIAEQRLVSRPVILPNKQPKQAPIKKDGTISPPLKPAPKVITVKIIFNKKAKADMESGSVKQRSITKRPAPL